MYGVRGSRQADWDARTFGQPHGLAVFLKKLFPSEPSLLNEADTGLLNVVNAKLSTIEGVCRISLWLPAGLVSSGGLCVCS